MTSNKIIIFGVTLYLIIVVIAYKIYVKKVFSGNELAGNAMAKGMTFLYGLGILFLIAVFFTSVGAFFYKNSSFWMKFLFFLPIFIPLFIFTLVLFDVEIMKIIDSNRNTFKEDKKIEFQKLTFEIRAKKQLNNSSLFFEDTKKKEILICMLGYKENNNENYFYVYEYKNTSHSKKNKRFYISTNKYETQAYNLELETSSKSKILDFSIFTNWKTIYAIHPKTKDSIKLEFRYKINSAN